MLNLKNWSNLSTQTDNTNIKRKQIRRFVLIEGEDKWFGAVLRLLGVVEEWKRAAFIILPKKGDLQLCSNHRTISLISHPSKIMLKIIMKRLENILETEVNKTQAGFRKGRGTRDHIFNLRNIIEKFREIDEDLHICFIDYSKAFGCVINKHLWKTLRYMGIHNNIVKLIVNLYPGNRQQ